MLSCAGARRLRSLRRRGGSTGYPVISRNTAGCKLRWRARQELGSRRAAHYHRRPYVRSKPLPRRPSILDPSVVQIEACFAAEPHLTAVAIVDWLRNCAPDTLRRRPAPLPRPAATMIAPGRYRQLSACPAQTQRERAPEPFRDMSEPPLPDLAVCSRFGRLVQERTVINSLYFYAGPVAQLDRASAF